MGRWGSGIALQFAERFPRSYWEYMARCRYGVKPGEVFICSPENGYQVVCIFASRGYAGHGDSPLDSPNRIIEATKRAIRRLPVDKPIHMPMINAGLFKVPWEQTAVLFTDDERDITVWTLPNK